MTYFASKDSIIFKKTMKTKNKVHLQCGYEDRCKNKECLKCSRRQRMSISITHAEMIAVEDFGVCDLQAMLNEKPEEMELLQNIMQKFMYKLFRAERKNDGR